jgi:uncharacterized membrane protein YeaQ/YmgE (transglycosylase-associated protein family)
MFPVSLQVIYVSIAEFAVIGMLIGVLAGFLASLALKLRRRWVALDALLGLVGFYIGLVVCGLIPFELPSTLGFLVAGIFGAALPILRQVFRFKRLKSAPK